MTDKRSKRISTLGARLTSLVSVFLVLLLLGATALTIIAGSRLRNEVRRSVGFVLVMERECPQGTLDVVKRMLMASPGVDKFSFTSAEDILSTESEYIGSDIKAMVDANPYTSEFEVFVEPDYAVPDSLDMLVARFAEVPGVKETVYESELAAGLDRAITRAGIILSAIALILLVVSIGLINNTVSLSIYGRRFIIHTMKLVGATGGFIRRPFVIAALEGGLAAGAVAGIVLLIARHYAPGFLPSLAGLLDWTIVAVVAVCLVMVGGLLCALTAYFAAGRYIRASYDEMFMK